MPPQGRSAGVALGLVYLLLGLSRLPFCFAESKIGRDARFSEHWRLRAPRDSSIRQQWGRLLNASLLFYEAQRAGKLPPDNRIPWRSDSALKDGEDAGLDLSKGYFDAGDHMKFMLPLASVTTHLAWGAIDFADGYLAAGQMKYVRETIKWATDWIISAHPEPNVLAVQVGSLKVDHGNWTSHESLPYPRPTFVINATQPGTDVAAQAAAALAAASMVFAADDLPAKNKNETWQRYPGYSATLLKHAKELYNFSATAKPYTRYQFSVADDSFAYPSSGFMDELVYGALWLYRATGTKHYADLARWYFSPKSMDLAARVVADGAPTLDWDGKWGGVYVLSAIVFDEPYYTAIAAQYVDALMPLRQTFTAGGLLWSKRNSYWQSNGVASNQAFLALVFAKTKLTNGTSPVRRAKLEAFALSQMRYLLGENPMNATYMVGVAENSPKRVHHSTAAGPDQHNPGSNIHTITGAVVNGPFQDDSWADDREDYVRNEVSINTNGLLTGVLAAFCGELLPSQAPAFTNSTLKHDETVLSGIDWKAVDSPEPFPPRMRAKGPAVAKPRGAVDPPPNETGEALPTSGDGLLISKAAIAGIAVAGATIIAIAAIIIWKCREDAKDRRKDELDVLELQKGGKEGYEWSMFDSMNRDGAVTNDLGRDGDCTKLRRVPSMATTVSQMGSDGSFGSSATMTMESGSGTEQILSHYALPSFGDSALAETSAPTYLADPSYGEQPYRVIADTPGRQKNLPAIPPDQAGGSLAPPGRISPWAAPPLVIPLPQHIATSASSPIDAISARRFPAPRSSDLAHEGGSLTRSAPGTLPRTEPAGDNGSPAEPAPILFSRPPLGMFPMGLVLNNDNVPTMGRREARDDWEHQVPTWNVIAGLESSDEPRPR